MMNFIAQGTMLEGSAAVVIAAAAALPASAANYEPYRGTEFLKLHVATNDNEKIGKVEDYAVDLKDGQIVYVVLKKGNEMTAVPFGAFKFKSGGELLLDTSRDRFDSAPKFDPGKWNTIGDLRWGEVVHRHFALADQWDDSAANPDPLPLIQGSKLTNLLVENKQERGLGKIDDFIINIHDGEFAYAVLQPDSALNLGNNKMLPVPWDAVAIKGEGANVADHKLVLNKGVGELASAPTFNRNDWPRFSDRQWNKQVTEFYGVNPDWLNAMGGEGKDKPNKPDKPDKPDAGMPEADKNKHDLTGWQADGQYVKLYDPKTVETIRGTIVDYDQFKTRPDGAPGVFVLVRANDGKEHVVHLGPKWFVDQQGMKFDKGKEVNVTGSRVQFEGKPVIIAREIKHGEKSFAIRNDKGAPKWVKD